VRAEPPAFAPPLPAQVQAGGVRDWQVREQYNPNVAQGIAGLNYNQGLQTMRGMNVNYLEAPAGTFNYSGAQMTALTANAGR
jgi:hypothetical protein